MGERDFAWESGGGSIYTCPVFGFILRYQLGGHRYYLLEYLLTTLIMNLPKTQARVRYYITYSQVDQDEAIPSAPQKIPAWGQ